MTQRQITLECLRLARSGAAAIGNIKDLQSAVNVLLRIVVGDRVRQDELAQAIIRAPRQNVLVKFIARVQAAIESSDRDVLDDAELRLECMRLAFGEGLGLGDVDALQDKVDLYFEIVAGQNILPATNPGNPKKRGKGSRAGSG